MSYIGEGDMPVTFIVPQSNCELYQGNDGAVWTLVHIPPEFTKDYPSVWSSILVRTDQVRRTSVNGLNGIINVNDNAKIKCAVRGPGFYTKITEILTPKQILARYLKWYVISNLNRRKIKYTEFPSEHYYETWQESKTRLLEYILQYR